MQTFNLIRIKDKVTGQYYLPQIINQLEQERFIKKFVYSGLNNNPAFDAKEYEYQKLGEYNEDGKYNIDEQEPINIGEKFDLIVAKEERNENLKL